MYCLGIESTAHTFSCAVIEKKQKNGKILSDVRKIYKPPEGEGIHPREASRHHIENSSSVLKQCLDEAKIKINDLDMIAYAGGPGLDHVLELVQLLHVLSHHIMIFQFILSIMLLVILNWVNF